MCVPLIMLIEFVLGWLRDQCAKSFYLHDMRSIRWFHDHLAADLGLQELELGVLTVALGAMHDLTLNVKHLVSNEERLGAIAPLDNLRVALHLHKETNMVWLSASDMSQNSP